MFLIFIILIHSPLFSQNKTNSEIIINLNEIENYFPPNQVQEKDLSLFKLIKTEELSKGIVKRYSYKLIGKRYLFPIYLSLSNNKIIDSYILLPTSYLHPLFLNELIKKFGKTQSIFEQETSKIFIWEINNLKVIYHAQCSITCFPHFLQISSLSDLKSFEDEYIPLLDFLNKSE